MLRLKSKISVEALVDISPDALKKRSDQLGGVKHQFADWREMFAKVGNDIDAVDICLPHHLHAPAILDACAAGKHVLCEKPMCVSLAEADQIAAAVKRAGVTYMSAHNQLFMPVVQEAKKRIDAGVIGDVRFIRSQDCFRAGGPTGNPNWGWRASSPRRAAANSSTPATTRATA
ncbi:MAG: Gfo/Idh/MocA family oxidoreductase [Tepidisphaeraceae bacterium]